MEEREYTGGGQSCNTQLGRYQTGGGCGSLGSPTLLRLKLYAFSLYDPGTGNRGCPHLGCDVSTAVTMHHVFWGCPAAAALRQVFLQRWLEAGLSTEDVEHALFSMALPYIPAGWWTAADQSLAGDPTEHGGLVEEITETAERCWRYGAMAYFQAVWAWRVAMFTGTSQTERRRRGVMLANRLRSGYRHVTHLLRPGPQRGQHEKAGTIAIQLLTGDWTPAAGLAPTGNHQNLLFFDGGSRDNPGPGGGGVVIVKIYSADEGHCAWWAGSMSYAAPWTTNNIAERQGLLMGLKGCLRHNWMPVHVVGDSQMIVTQMRTRKPPKAAHLRRMYWHSRKIADTLRVASWTHHLRAYNKMADATANEAMDTQRSAQSVLTQWTGATTKWTQVYEHVGSDVGHWRTRQTHESLSGLGAFTL